MKKGILLAVTASVAALAIGAFAFSKGPSPKEEAFPRHFETITEAIEAIPAEYKSDFELLRSCLGDEARQNVRTVPPLDVDRVADIMDQLLNDPQAAEQCLDRLQ